MKHIISIIAGFILARLYYRRHIAIAQEHISAEMAQKWVERMSVDVRF